MRVRFSKGRSTMNFNKSDHHKLRAPHKQQQTNGSTNGPTDRPQMDQLTKRLNTMKFV